jgi:hypothetical protein
VRLLHLPGAEAGAGVAVSVEEPERGRPGGGMVAG